MVYQLFTYWGWDQLKTTIDGANLHLVLMRASSRSSHLVSLILWSDTGYDLDVGIVIIADQLLFDQTFLINITFDFLVILVRNHILYMHRVSK